MFYVTHRLKLDKVHETVPFEQNNWFGKEINLNTQKINEAINGLQNGFYIILNKAFYGKTMENVRKRF